MASSADGGRPASEITHHRETIRYIVLPMVGVGALMLVGAIIVLFLPGRLQVSLIADWLFTILFLCPIVLCLLPLCIVMVMGVVAMNKANNAAANPLRRLENFSANLKDRAVQATDTINRKTINASAKWAFVDRLLAVFDPPPSPSDDVNKEG